MALLVERIATIAINTTVHFLCHKMNDETIERALLPCGHSYLPRLSDKPPIARGNVTDKWIPILCMFIVELHC